MSDIPNSSAKIQQEAAQTTRPASEALLFAMGGAINYSLTQVAKVGDVVMSALDATTFQSERDTTWVACDGRSVVGSDYQTLTGQANIPDMRGGFPRGKSNMNFVTGGHTGTGYSSRNPDGDLAIGTYTADKIASHTHPYTVAFGGVTAAAGTDGPTAPATGASTTGATGGAETAGKSIMLNFFIKINA